MNYSAHYARAISKKYTGLTRETPVQKIQHGEVKLFLISLKAGGARLTLAAASALSAEDLKALFEPLT